MSWLLTVIVILVLIPAPGWLIQRNPAWGDIEGVLAGVLCWGIAAALALRLMGTLLGKW